jgi:tetratricopeptide (TPR) repeat protein
MAQEHAKQLLQQGIAAARNSQPEAARELLQRAIQLDPENETAWLWLSSVARDNKERRFCLKQLLALNPDNEHAIKGLRALGVEVGAPVQEGGVGMAGSIPVLAEDKFTRLQPALDDILRRRSSEPPDALNITWAPKRRRRYGEGGAARLRQATYATAAVVVLGAVIGLVALLAALGVLDGDDGPEVAALSTRVPSATPTLTLTPTPGGATPTPLPLEVAAILTSTPAGLPRGVAAGSAFEFRPTAIYPRVDAAVANSIQDAVNYYSVGEYDRAVGTLEAEHALSGDHCYPVIVYYEALSHAEKGTPADLNRAERILTEALAYQPPNARFSSCQDSPLIFAGLAHVSYLQGGGKLNSALSWSSRALAADPRLVPASVTKARVELAQGQIATAWSTINAALSESPGDVNLLIMLAEIELANGQANTALDVIRQALYIEPASQAALQLQARTTLMLAEQSPDEESGRARYGLAVLSAQTLLLYYPGDPLGYLLLARARVGEGNYRMAETALNRILTAQADLPDETAGVVQEAYRIRGDLFYRQGRLLDARADLRRVVPSGDLALDSAVNLSLAEIDFRLGEYGSGLNRVEQLLVDEPENLSYRLLKARALVELCTFYPDELACDYRDMFAELDDEMITALASDAQRADAYSYRGQARYWLTMRNRSLDDDERDLELRLALNDIDQALAIRQRAVEHYFRGLLLAELAEPVPALNEFEWVMLWQTRYGYPFVDEAFERRVVDIAQQVVEQLGEAAPPEDVPEPEEPEESGEPSPTAAPPTATPTPTATPAPTQPTPTATSPAGMAPRVP